VYEAGDTQAAKAAPSSEHSKLDPASLAVNENVATMSVVLVGGAEVIVVCGGVVSGACTVHEWLAGVASTFPAASRARTWKVWAPAATVYVLGVVQPANAEPSSEHSNVDPASLEVNENDALVLVVPEVGADVMVVFGGVVSAVLVQFRVAGVASTFPAASRARTRNVCEPGATVTDVGETQAA
jgi:hypothetical protein